MMIVAIAHTTSRHTTSTTTTTGTITAAIVSFDSVVMVTDGMATIMVVYVCLVIEIMFGLKPVVIVLSKLVDVMTLEVISVALVSMVTLVSMVATAVESVPEI